MQEQAAKGIVSHCNKEQSIFPQRYTSTITVLMAITGLLICILLTACYLLHGQSTAASQSILCLNRLKQGRVPVSELI